MHSAETTPPKTVRTVEDLDDSTLSQEAIVGKHYFRVHERHLFRYSLQDGVASSPTYLEGFYDVQGLVDFQGYLLVVASGMVEDRRVYAYLEAPPGEPLPGDTDRSTSFDTIHSSFATAEVKSLGGILFVISEAGHLYTMDSRRSGLKIGTTVIHGERYSSTIPTLNSGDKQVEFEATTLKEKVTGWAPALDRVHDDGTVDVGLVIDGKEQVLAINPPGLK